MLIPVLLSWHYFDVPVSIKWQCGYHCKVTMLVLMTPVSSGNAGIVRLIYSSQCVRCIISISLSYAVVLCDCDKVQVCSLLYIN